MNRILVIKFFDENGVFKGFYTDDTQYTKFKTTDGDGNDLPVPLISTSRPAYDEPTVYEFTRENYEWVQGIMIDLKECMREQKMKPYRVMLGVYECFDHFTGEEDFLNVKSELTDSSN